MEDYLFPNILISEASLFAQDVVSSNDASGLSDDMIVAPAISTVSAEPFSLADFFVEPASDWFEQEAQNSNEGAIIVTGWRPSSGGGFEWYFDDGGNGYDTSYDQGGGDSTEPPLSYADHLADECNMDLLVDSVAQRIADLIKSRPDWNEREYGAVVYMVGGEIRIGELARGQTVAEAIAAGLTAPRTSISPPSDLGDGLILAVVHSHPDIGYDAVGDARNMYPSDTDYDTFDQMAGNGIWATDSRFANNVSFAQYILGPDGVLREFNKVDGRTTPSNDTSPTSRAELRSDRPCHQ